MCFDASSSSVIITSNSEKIKVSNSYEQLIPFVPYPTFGPTNQLVPCDKLKELERMSDLKYFAPMFDTTTGLSVPICAVTIHPLTGKIYTLGSFKTT